MGVKVEKLKEKIIQEGQVIGEEVLKVDRFLNHQIDPRLMQAIGEEFGNYFEAKKITKIITIEASGIAPAVFAGLVMGVPVVVAKKNISRTMTDELATAEVYSFTKQQTYQISISKSLISENDTVLIVDDFLANGHAVLGLIEICQQLKADVAGAGIVIEKAFQQGRSLLEERGLDIYSLARIQSLKNNEVTFKE